jgi:tetratricopeptide (TPR) repeat protein
MSDNGKTSLDDRCSAACTRAGTFALLLSAIAIALLNPIATANVRYALLSYISHRLALKESVDQIHTNSCWQTLNDQRREPDQTENLTISELLKYECKEESVPSNNQLPRKISIRATESIPKSQSYLAWDPPEPQTKKPEKLNPPRNLRFVETYPLPNLDVIVITLAQLEDVNLLNTARQYSPKFNGLIYRWQMARHQADVKNLSTEGQSPIKPMVTDTRSITLSQTVLKMSLADLKRLADLHLPDANSFEDIRGGEPRLQTPAIPFQIQLEAGSILLELGILLAVMYFWLFYREAHTSTSFPAAGTLFGAFCRTSTSNIIFRLLILVPASASVILSVWTLTHSSSNYVKATVISSFLVVLFTVDVLRLSSPSYAHALYASVQGVLLKFRSRWKLQQKFSDFRDLAIRILFRTLGAQWPRVAFLLVLISATTIGIVVLKWPTIRLFPIISQFTQKSLPRADPKRFTIAVTHLDNDPDSKYDRLIAKEIEKLGGVQVLLFDRTILLSRRGTPGDMESAGQKKAREFLEEAGAQAVIWGLVNDFDEKSTFRAFWTTQTKDAKSVRTYDLQDFRLPDLFLSDLIDILRLIVLTQDGLLYERGPILADQIEPLIDRVKKFLKESPQDRDRRTLTRTRIKFILADFLGSLGALTGQTQLLEDSVTIYREVLQELSEEPKSLNRSATQNNLGNVLKALGERAPGTKRLEEALAAYNAALKERTREHDPVEWAKITGNIGTVLQGLGEREPGTKLLQEAVSLHRESLKELNRERVPKDWARAQIALGIALQSLGERETGTTHFEESIALLHEVLNELSRETVPMDWARIQNNLGNALQYLGQRTSDRKPLEEAVAAHRESLKEWTRERVPLNWALAQNNLGTALRRLGELESNKNRLDEAVDAHRQALKVWRRDLMPLKWADGQEQLNRARNSIRNLTTARTRKAISKRGHNEVARV